MNYLIIKSYVIKSFKTRGQVADIKEIPSDFFALEPHVFMVSGAANPIKNLVE